MDLRSWICSSMIALLAFVLASCGKPSATSRPQPTKTVDPCTLLTREEVEAVQKSKVTDTKSSERLDGAFRVAQCFYTTAEFNKSINVALMQNHPTNTKGRTAREFWRETFEEGGEKREKEGREEEEEGERTPPKKVDGLGDDARWAANRFGGILYVLKGDAFISISIGGTDSEEVKIDKCKALAEKVVPRM